LNFEPDLDMVKTNQQAEHLDQRSFSLKVIVVQAHTHTPDHYIWTTKMAGKDLCRRN